MAVELSLPEGGVLSGRPDAVRGRQVIDYKTTKRIDLERYADSLQWRCYLMMLPWADTFRYEVFRIGRVTQTKRPERGHSGQIVTIDGHSRLDLNRYDGLEQDVRNAVYEYAEFLMGLHKRGIIALDEKGRPIRPETQP